MKKHLLASALLSCLSATALHAGSAETAFPPEMAAMGAHNWAGFYAGAGLGLNFGTVDVTDVDSFLGGNFVFQNIETSGFVPTVLAGYNFQSGNMVFGLEADYAFGGASGSSAVDLIFLDETLEWQTNWAYSIRGRVGLVSNDWLFFGTAGIAGAGVHFGLLNMNDLGTIVEADIRQTQTFSGWVAGIGAERALGEHLVIRGEVLHTMLNYRELDAFDVTSTVGYAPSSTEIRAAVIWSF